MLIFIFILHKMFQIHDGTDNLKFVWSTLRQETNENFDGQVFQMETSNRFITAPSMSPILYISEGYIGLAAVSQIFQNSISTLCICVYFILVGLDAAGKTTILYKLKLGEIVTTIPTIGKLRTLSPPSKPQVS